jgi:hypothetical protein
MMTMVGILQSAAWLSNVADEPTLAKDLIKGKEVANSQDIDLNKVWKGERV